MCYGIMRGGGVYCDVVLFDVSCCVMLSFDMIYCGVVYVSVV